MPLHYTVTEGTEGSGCTIDVSSSGLSFLADGNLDIRQPVKMSLDWPAALDSGVNLQLVVSGEIVRTDGAIAAMKIDQHEFKTRPGRRTR